MRFTPESARLLEALVAGVTKSNFVNFETSGNKSA